MNKILVCTGFHRSASSVTAHHLDNAGLPMGIHLMGGGISNYGGHYEDWPVVNLHERLLDDNDTNWQFHDEVVLSTRNLAPFLKYIQLRDQYAFSWGFKDPRSSLFLNEWDQALNERGRYLFLVRHWSSSIESLLRRHSRRLSHGLIRHQKEKVDFNFWLEPDLGAKMWLAYNARLLAFAEQKAEQCLIVTQRALFNDIPLIKTLNENFGFKMDQNSESVFNSGQLKDLASSSVNNIFSEGVREQLEDTWSRLIAMAHFKTDDESPFFIDKTPLNENFLRQLNSIKTNALDDKSSSRDGAKEEAGSVYTLWQKINHAQSSDEVSDLIHEDRIKQKTELREDVTELIHLIQNSYKTSTHVNLVFSYWLKSNKEWSSAIEFFRRTIYLGVKLASIHLNIAQCYEFLGESEMADKSFKVAMNTDPDNPLFLTIYGRFLRGVGKADAALKYLKEGAELAWDDPRCVLPYCEMLEQSNQINKAYALVTKLSDANPNNIMVREILLRFTLKNDPLSGELLYKNMVNKQINAIGRHYEWLADISNKIAVEPVRADFINRVSHHWDEIDLN